MPIMSGLEATALLRARGIRIPIIAVTGNALAEDVAAFMAAGSNQVLLKPISRNVLVAALSKYIHLPGTPHSGAGGRSV